MIDMYFLDILRAYMAIPGVQGGVGDHNVG